MWECSLALVSGNMSSPFVPAAKLHCCIFKESKVFGEQPNLTVAIKG